MTHAVAARRDLLNCGIAHPESLQGLWDNVFCPFHCICFHFSLSPFKAKSHIPRVLSLHSATHKLFHSHPLSSNFPHYLSLRISPCVTDVPDREGRDSGEETARRRGGMSFADLPPGCTKGLCILFFHPHLHRGSHTMLHVRTTRKAQTRTHHKSLRPH